MGEATHEAGTAYGKVRGRGMGTRASRGRAVGVGKTYGVTVGTVIDDGDAGATGVGDAGIPAHAVSNRTMDTIMLVRRYIE